MNGQAPCKTDRERNLWKVVSCSCVVVKDDGKEFHDKDVLKEYFKFKKWTNKTLVFYKKKKKKAPLVVTGSQPKGEEAGVEPEGPRA